MSLQGFVMKIPIFIMNVMTNGPGGITFCSSKFCLQACLHLLFGRQAGEGSRITWKWELDGVRTP